MGEITVISQKNSNSCATERPGTMRSNRRSSFASTGTCVSLSNRSTFRSGISPPVSVSICLQALTMMACRELSLPLLFDVIVAWPWGSKPSYFTARPSRRRDAHHIWVLTSVTPFVVGQIVSQVAAYGPIQESIRALPVVAAFLRAVSPPPSVRSNAACACFSRGSEA